MLGVSGLGMGYSYYQNPYAGSVGRSGAAQKTEGAGRSVSVSMPAAQPDVPVGSVSPVPAVDPVQLDRGEMMRRWENDPAAMAARDRIEYIAGEEHDQSAVITGVPQSAEQQSLPGTEGVNQRGSLQLGRSRTRASAEDSARGVALPGFADEKAEDAVKLPGKAEEAESAGKFPGYGDGEKKAEGGEDVKSAQETMEESECQTCKNRKYQDGSDDPGVSFKNPTHIDPDMAASQVRGHEMEHVVREQASARMEDRKVVSQSVTYHTAICPECGRVYVSGGTTRTTTAARPEQDAESQAEQLKMRLIPGLGDEEEEEKEENKNILGIPSVA